MSRLKEADALIGLTDRELCTKLFALDTPFSGLPPEISALLIHVTVRLHRANGGPLSDADLARTLMELG